MNKSTNPTQEHYILDGRANYDIDAASVLLSCKSLKVAKANLHLFPQDAVIAKADVNGILEIVQYGKIPTFIITTRKKLILGNAETLKEAKEKKEFLGGSKIFQLVDGDWIPVHDKPKRTSNLSI